MHSPYLIKRNYMFGSLLVKILYFRNHLTYGRKFKRRFFFYSHSSVDINSDIRSLVYGACSLKDTIQPGRIMSKHSSVVTHLRVGTRKAYSELNCEWLYRHRQRCQVRSEMLRYVDEKQTAQLPRREMKYLVTHTITDDFQKYVKIWSS